MKIEIKIINMKTGEIRFVLGEAGDVIPVGKSERVLDQWPIGVIKEGDPVLILEERTVVESPYMVWDVRKSPEIPR